MLSTKVMSSNGQKVGRGTGSSFWRRKGIERNLTKNEGRRQYPRKELILSHSNPKGEPLVCLAGTSALEKKERNILGFNQSFFYKKGRGTESNEALMKGLLPNPDSQSATL